jgi:hypothetical protein
VRIKLRPGCHFAPTEHGLLCRFHHSSFVVGGPVALFGLLDSRIGALMDGTDTTTLAASAGPAAPVLEKILDILLERGYAFDLDAAGGPVPDPETAARHEDLLSHLEEYSPRPYAALAALRSALVSVRGGGPAAATAGRALESFGLKTSPADAADPARLTILIDDEQEPLGLLAADSPASAAILPLLAGAELIVVGPVLDDVRRLPAFLAAADRAACWQRTDPTAPAPHRVGASLAGSLAARRALDHLAALDGIDGAGDLLVVHGHAASVARVPFTARGTAPTWQPLAPEHLDAEDRDPDDDQLAPLTAPWRGLARRRGGTVESGRPVVAVALEPLVPKSDGLEVGWGSDMGSAGRSGALALLRTHVESVSTANDAGEPDDRAVAAAGSSVARWFLDGLLRLLARDALRWQPDHEVRWEDLDSSTTRSLWSAVADYHASPVDLAEHRVAGVEWHLVSARDRGTGAVVAAEWGPTMQTAAYAALGTMFARREQRPEKVAVRAVGTHCVELLPEPAVRAVIERLAGGDGPAGRGVSALRLSSDPVLGTLPVPCGWIWRS